MGYQPLPPPPTAYAETHRWHRYDKKFAYLPTYCGMHGGWIWLKQYYEKYLVYSYKEINDISYYRYKLTEEWVIIEKLSEDH